MPCVSALIVTDFFERQKKIEENFMKITRLTAENIKRIKAVEITQDGNLVVIGGRNAQGKTSVLDSITYALAGALSHPDRPIRDGQDKAKIVCELDDLIVTRTFTPKGGSLIVLASLTDAWRFAGLTELLLTRKARSMPVLKRCWTN